MTHGEDLELQDFQIFVTSTPIPYSILYLSPKCLKYQIAARAKWLSKSKPETLNCMMKWINLLNLQVNSAINYASFP